MRPWYRPREDSGIAGQHATPIDRKAREVLRSAMRICLRQGGRRASHWREQRKDGPSPRFIPAPAYQDRVNDALSRLENILMQE